MIGDSTAAVLGHGLVEYADEHKNIVVDSEGVNGCALSDARAQNMVREQEWASVPAKCRHWATRLAADVSFRPDVVLAVFGPAEIADLELGDHGPAGDVRRADVQASAAAEVARLRALFPRARFVWATAPLTFTGNQELPEGDWLINDPVRIGAWNRLVAEFAHDPHSSMLDLAAFFATAPGGWRNRSWRPDGAHLQGVALTRAAQWTVVQLKHIQHSA